MRMFYDTMPTPEMMEFHIELQGRKMMKTIQLHTHQKNVQHVIRLLKNRLSVEGDRLHDVKSVTLYNQKRKATVQKALDLPYKDDKAQDILEHWLGEMRKTVVTGGLHNGY